MQKTIKGELTKDSGANEENFSSQTVNRTWTKNMLHRRDCCFVSGAWTLRTVMTCARLTDTAHVVHQNEQKKYRSHRCCWWREERKKMPGVVKSCESTAEESKKMIRLASYPTFGEEWKGNKSREPTLLSDTSRVNATTKSKDSVSTLRLIAR